jgi:hypothetical protein
MTIELEAKDCMVRAVLAAVGGDYEDLARVDYVVNS